MKKQIVWLLLSALLLCSGCTATSTGCAAEMTAHAWAAETDGGGRATLCFQGDKAALMLENGGKTEKIAGSYVADSEVFVIFDDAAKRSFRFCYEPKGDALTVSCDGAHSLTFHPI